MLLQLNSYALTTTLLTDGIHLLEVTSTSSEGWHSTATATFTVANFAGRGVRITINQPSPTGGPVSGLTLVAGWAFAPSFSTSDVSISIDGISYGKALYGNSRPDVCVFYFGCPNVGWSFLLDTTHLTNGPHKLSVTAGGGTVATWFAVGNPLTN